MVERQRVATNNIQHNVQESFTEKIFTKTVLYLITWFN